MTLILMCSAPPPPPAVLAQIVLPSDPPNAGVDLAIDANRDLAFPSNSFMGAGAFGQVRGRQLPPHTSDNTCVHTRQPLCLAWVCFGAMFRRESLLPTLARCASPRLLLAASVGARCRCTARFTGRATLWQSRC